MFFLGFFVGIVLTIIAVVWYSLKAESKNIKRQDELIKRISEGFCFDDKEDYNKRYES